MSVNDIDRDALVSAVAASRVLVVGDAMLDRYWTGDASRISPEAPVPVVQVRQGEDRPGGAANVALNIQVLGASATLRSVMGDDADGRILSELLAAAGVETHCDVDPALRTTLKLRVVARNQQMLRVDFEDVPGETVLDRLWAGFQGDDSHYDVVIFSDYAKGGLRDVAQMIALAKARRQKVLVDPKGRDFTPYRGADVITPNLAELRPVIGPWIDEHELQRKVERLCERLEIGALLLTRSEEGMTLFEGGRVLHVPAQPVEIADVTGAGDTVIAVLALMVAAGVPMGRAIQLANRAGGIAVGKFGTAALTAVEVFGLDSSARLGPTPS